MSFISSDCMKTDELPYFHSVWTIGYLELKALIFCKLILCKTAYFLVNLQFLVISLSRNLSYH